MSFAVVLQAAAPLLVLAATVAQTLNNPNGFSLKFRLKRTFMYFWMGIGYAWMSTSYYVPYTMNTPEVYAILGANQSSFSWVISAELAGLIVGFLVSARAVIYLKTYRRLYFYTYFAIAACDAIAGLAFLFNAASVPLLTLIMFVRNVPWASYWTATNAICRTYFEPNERGLFGAVLCAYNALSYLFSRMLVIFLPDHASISFLLPVAIMTIAAVLTSSLVVECQVPMEQRYDSDTDVEKAVAPAELELEDKSEAPSAFETSSSSELATSSDSTASASADTKMDWSLLQDPKLWLLITVGVTASVLRETFLVWYSPYFEFAEGLSGTSSSAVALGGLLTIMGILTPTFGGWLSDVVFRANRKPVLAMYSLLCVLGFLVLPVINGSLVMIFLVTACVFGGMYAVCVTLVAVVPNDFAAQADFILSLLCFLLYGGAMVANPFIAALVESQGFSVFPAICITLAFITAAAAIVLLCFDTIKSLLARDKARAPLVKNMDLE